MIAAFSRSSRPMRPISEDSVMCAPGSALAKISPAIFSHSLDTGENTAEMATVSMPFCRMSSAMPSSSASSSGEMMRPSNSLPPWAR